MVLLLLAPVPSRAQTHSHHKPRDPSADDSQPTPPADAPVTNDSVKKTDANPTGKAAPDREASGLAATSTISPAEIKGFDQQPEPIHRLLSTALDLTSRGLKYAYGSADPSTGGMDCSGTIYYILTTNGFKDAPRDASGQYAWVRKQSQFNAVLSRRDDTFELDDLRPGDLLFWTGTYLTQHDPPVTHTMIYLGARKTDGKRLMVGASDGRSYDGQRRNGVSVFDFKIPAAQHDDGNGTPGRVIERQAAFAGYGSIPGIRSHDAAK